MNNSRYTIGIDLGTSNCALAYVDTLASDPKPQILAIDQLISAETHARRELLPSFLLYQNIADETEEQTEISIGTYAKNESLNNPSRVIHSAKSWLAHGGINRDDKILPWQSSEVATSNKLSPLEATTKLLEYIKDAWDSSLGAAHSSYEFSKQQVTVTVPASFDDVAQKLTLEAAATAGYPVDLRLLEEPQAAFYYWLSKQTSSTSLAEALLSVFPDISSRSIAVLVCDIGGGTSDFSMFELSIYDDTPSVTRINVSDHLLLGGDNIDLAIAHTLESQLSKNKLDPNSWNSLVAQSRQLKERALSDKGSDEETLHISIAGRGSSLFEQTQSASIEREELERIVLDGFYPACDKDAKPQKSSGGLIEFGLPYAKDVGITRHLASFLDGKAIDAVLYNGGSMKPDFLQRHLSRILEDWQGSAPQILKTDGLDLAVALGAAQYGTILRSPHGRITGGYPRTIYVEVQRNDRTESRELVCILPKGTEEGSTLHLSQPKFKVLVEAPVQFQLYYSNSRLGDKPGDVISFESANAHELPPIQTLLTLEKGTHRPRDGLLSVKLNVSLSETGILKVSCIHDIEKEDAQTWDLEFNLRNANNNAKHSTQEGVDESLPAKFGKGVELIRSVYGKSQQKGSNSIEPRAIPKELEKLFELPREDWSTHLLRSIWPELVRGMTRRARSLHHETTWLYLAGFCLRPGYGSSLDSEYLDQLWRCFSLGLSFPKEARAVIQWHIMWRRVAPGLTTAQQATLFKSLRKYIEKKPESNLEALRLACSLERIDSEDKIRVGTQILRATKRTRSSQRQHLVWELGRLAARAPLHAPIHYVVPPQIVAEWLSEILSIEWSKTEASAICNLAVQASRLTEDRSSRLDDKSLLAIRRKLKNLGADERQILPLTEVVPLTKDDKVLLFGDSLPSGLSI